METPLYHYHPGSGELLNQTLASPDPLEPEKVLVPAYATTQPPPTPAANQAAVFDGSAWALVADYRGTDYWLGDGTPGQITALGDTLPAGATTTAPEPTLDGLKAAKKAWIEGERDKRLVDPAATVLVNGATFQMDPRSHAELNDALTTFTALGAVPPGYEWRDASNTNHPADLALLAAIATARAEQKKLIWETSWAKKAAADAATTEAELDAITW